jgi:serine/threonine protein kinase
MGEVYRARDTKLGRDVAIKVLRATLTNDPDRLARFQREAQVLAALNHPNIAAIHHFEETSDGPALVMELVEGETIADRIAREPIPIDEALPIAKQIAEALEAAHEQGIIHRDLKPANIKVRPDGAVKVLDFGLAKLAEPGLGIGDTRSESARAAASLSPTVTSPVRTGVGVLLGTAAYMSPEQAKGRPADKRSDMWAFGCVLYEMLTGARAFRGEDFSETLAAVLKSEPDWRLLPRETPPSIRRVLRRCLAKDRKARLADASTVGLDIDEAVDGQTERDVDVRRPPSRLSERIAWMTALVVVITIAAVIGFRAVRPVPPTAEMRLEITTPATTEPTSLAISPDGRYVAFEATTENRSQLWLRSLDALETQPIAGTENGVYPFWSADGRSLGFYADGKLKRINLNGREVQTLANAPVARGGTWSDDGVILFSASNASPILRIPATGGEPTPATQLAAAQFHGFPQWLPDRRHFLFYVQSAPDSRGVYVGDIENAGTRRRLVDADSSAVFTSSGQLLFVRQGTLFAQDFDPARLRLTGNAYPVAEQIAVGEEGTSGSVALSTSQTGTVVYRSGLPRERQLVWVDRHGNELQKIGAPATSVLNPSISPDGRRIAVQRNVDGNIDIWLLEVSRGLFSRFTFEPSTEANPLWSPDGTRIVFASNRTGALDIYQKSVAGADDQPPVIATPQTKTAMDWSLDGRFLLYRVTDSKLGFDIWSAPMVGDGKPFPVVQTPFDERDAQFSPDGKWIAYQSNESGAFEIYVQPFPGPGTKERISTNGGAQVRWRRDGKELFYVALDGRLMAVPIRVVDEGQQLEAGTPIPLFNARIGSPVPALDRQQYIVAADGQRFLLNAVTGESRGSPITILLNWQEERKRIVPTK